MIETMRLLVACSSCKRQVDATGKTPGERFRCLCGETVVVPQPKSHSAAVIRCSACGAPRQHDSAACPHCGSDFTLHERDLNTLCPSCAARVSDRAAYCHHCATRLDPQGRAGKPTAFKCPACDSTGKLVSRDFGVAGLSILECPRCAGLWLGHDAFRHLVEKAAASPATSKIHAMAAKAAAKNADPSLPPVPQGRFYRSCPECSKLMQRRNYDDKSGVLIDVCGLHGVWFDDDELAAVLRWIRDGRSRLAKEQAAEFEASRPVTRPMHGSLPPVPLPPDDPFRQWSLLEFLLEVGGFLFRPLGRTRW